MERNIERESLVSAMAYCSLRELPPVDNGEEVWISALAKVLKVDGVNSYVLVQKDENGENRIMKDFGGVTAIREVKEYYPFSFLKASFLPRFKTVKKEERIAYLTKTLGNKKDWSAYTTKELDKMILVMAINNQKKKEKYG